MWPLFISARFNRFKSHHSYNKIDNITWLCWLRVQLEMCLWFIIKTGWSARGARCDDVIDNGQSPLVRISYQTVFEWGLGLPLMPFGVFGRNGVGGLLGRELHGSVALQVLAYYTRHVMWEEEPNLFLSNLQYHCCCVQWTNRQDWKIHIR